MPSNSEFFKIAVRTLDKFKKPMTAREIWDNAVKHNLLEGFTTKGKTPDASVGSHIYLDIKNNGEQATFCKMPGKGGLFYLRKYKDEGTENMGNSGKVNGNGFNERDLHPLVVKFAHSHFNVWTKTILHENSERKKKGENEWLHPDLVGAYFPFETFEKEVTSIQKELSLSSVRIFSFELKVNLGFGNLRQSYFQAVSNSSWANEGYLVTLNISSDSQFHDELRRLNNAFGIGIIKLNPLDISHCSILYPSRINNDLDWETINRLTVNKGFRKFLKDVSEDIQLKNVKSRYDEVKNDEEMRIYMKKKGIIN